MFNLPVCLQGSILPLCEAYCAESILSIQQSEAVPNLSHIPLMLRQGMQVIADERLAQRLVSTPMLATVLLHHPAKTGDPSDHPVPIGTAEVDLSGLLLPR